MTKKTAFEFNGQIYEWNSMIMGFKNSLQIFQRVMSQILGFMKGKGVEVYMDDIIVHAKGIIEHNRLLEEVLKRLKNNNMRINKGKIQLGKKEVKLLGVKVDGEKQMPEEIKKNEALEIHSQKE